MAYESEYQQDQILDVLEDAKTRVIEGRFHSISDWAKGSDDVMVKRLTGMVETLVNVAGNLAIQYGELRTDVAHLREQLDTPVDA